jgi:hypothetical protein
VSNLHGAFVQFIPFREEPPSLSLNFMYRFQSATKFLLAETVTCPKAPAKVTAVVFS